MAKVGIVMGSDSDLGVMSKAAEMLEKFGIEYEMTVISAHRMPDVFFDYANAAEEKGIKVKEVKLSSKLKTYPVCLTAQGEISIEMEKVLNSMPNAQNKVSAEKVLEINSEHKIIDRLSELYSSNQDTLKKYALVLYNQARLLEGLSVEDAGEFVTALADIM